MPRVRNRHLCLTNMSTSAADEICGAIIDELAPGSSEETRRSFETYACLYETPYAPTPELMGSWRGFVRTGAGDVPVTLRFTDVGEVNTVSMLRGGFRSSLTIHAEKGGEEVPFRLTLRLDGELLAGYASARFRSARGSFQVAAYVELRKVVR